MKIIFKSILSVFCALALIVLWGKLSAMAFLSVAVPAVGFAAICNWACVAICGVERMPKYMFGWLVRWILFGTMLVTVFAAFLGGLAGPHDSVALFGQNMAVTALLMAATYIVSFVLVITLCLKRTG